MGNPFQAVARREEWRTDCQFVLVWYLLRPKDWQSVLYFLDVSHLERDRSIGTGNVVGQFVIAPSPIRVVPPALPTTAEQTC